MNEPGPGRPRGLQNPELSIHGFHADGSFNGFGDAACIMLHCGCILGLHHDAGKPLGTRIADDNPSGIPKRRAT